jgi:hypothetical protein
MQPKEFNTRKQRKRCRNVTAGAGDTTLIFLGVLIFSLKYRNIAYTPFFGFTYPGRK